MKMKKLLAAALAATMMLSSMVSSFVASAAFAGTITAGDVEVTAGVTEVTVPVTIHFEDEVTAPHGMFTVGVEGATLTNAAIVDPTNKYLAQANPEGNIYYLWIEEFTAEGTILVESQLDFTLAEDVVINCTFEVPAISEDLVVDVKDIEATDYDLSDWDNVSADPGTIAVHEHVYTEEVTTAPSCTETGVKTFTCECGDTYTEEITALGHTEVIDAAVAPTCTETGLTEGKHCSVCSEVIVAQETVAALGHAWDEGVVTTAPDCDDAGVKTYTCGTCGETKTEAIDALGHTEVEIPAVDATCTTPGSTAGVKCSVCDAIITAPTEIPVIPHDFVEGTCTVCGAEDPDYVPACDHTDAVAEVTTQPTKDAVGTMTYTCACGESWTEEIAKPVATTAVTFKSDIVVTSVVGSNVTVSTKQMRDTYGSDATYFIVVDYKKYGTGYVLEDKTATLTSEDRLSVGSTANKDVISFEDIALYEMTLDFTMTAYFKNAEGIVVGYREFTNNVANMALVYAGSYSSNTTLLRAFADMCAYGDEAQTFFAVANPGTAICDAVLPSSILGESYMAYKSNTDGMPAAGEYNNDKGSTKIVSSTGFVSAGQTLKIDASNFISYTLRYDNYDWEDVQIKVHYEDSVVGYTEIDVTYDELIANGTAGNGQPKYTYYFKDLALYDCDKTVTMDMYYKGNLELTSVYSFGNYVNQYLGNQQFTGLLTAMELFSNSMGIQLGVPAKW